MPGITIGHLLAASQTTPYLPFDDTFLTGLCTAKAGIKVRISDRLLKQFESLSQHYLTTHKVISLKIFCRRSCRSARTLSCVYLYYVADRFCRPTQQFSVGQ